MNWEKATFVVTVMALCFTILTLIVAVLALICVAPFFFDRMGWKFPFAPTLPPTPEPPVQPERPFAPKSEELKTLKRISAFTEATGMFAIIQNTNDKSPQQRSDLIDCYHELYNQD